MQFYDINIQLGRASVRQYGQAASVDELFRMLDGTGITRGVVWHIAQRDAGPDVGNALVNTAIAGNERAAGCWSIVPPQTDKDVMTPDFFARMAAERIVALRAFPDTQRFQLGRTTFGAFLDEVAERRIPLLMSMRFGMEWPAIYRLLEEYPTLTVVLCDLGLWGQDRQSWPLLEKYPNVYLESSLVSLEAGGLEAAVKAWGAERILFGSGFPFHYPHAAVLDVLHADVSDRDREKIASGNLAKLLGEVAVV
jgi:predicted TIM-barrel fold metal-dependent hydrolase